MEIVTAPAGTVLNGGAFIVPEALGDKIIHPYSDFLLHDMGTGEGIQQNGGRSTAGKMRTAPLWGLWTRARFMHDGTSMTLMEAMLRHRGEAGSVTKAFLSLPENERERIITFLESL